MKTSLPRIVDSGQTGAPADKSVWRALKISACQMSKVDTSGSAVDALTGTVPMFQYSPLSHQLGGLVPLGSGPLGQLEWRVGGESPLLVDSTSKLRATPVVRRPLGTPRRPSGSLEALEAPRRPLGVLGAP